MPLTLFRVCLAIAVFWLACGTVGAAEYFVSSQGHDDRDGRSPATAFQTIQKGVDALAPGDILTIAPGEYFEAVSRSGLGSLDVETVIRAAIPGTVVLRGDVPAPAFTRLEPFETVYVADFDGDVQAVNEVDTPTILESTASLHELAFLRGGYFYDAEAKKLYIAPSDLRPAAEHHYTVSVTRGHGLHLGQPQRVTIEGLAARGFSSNSPLAHFPGYQAAWGIIIGGGRQCVIRNCIALVNGGGIAINSGRPKDAGGNLIENCRAYGNGSRYAGQGGNILIFAANDDEIRGCYAHSARNHGLRIYGSAIRGGAIIRDSLSWGNGGADIFIKGGSADTTGLAERSISLSTFQVANLRDSIMGGSNVYNANPSADNIRYASEAHDRRDVEFADPLNFDFRLQATSRFRGKEPEDRDRGPHPYAANVFYVSPEGSDEADGLSIRHAWGTLAHAMSRLGPGDTLYLEPGIYAAGPELRLGSAGEQVTAIRGRGHGRVMIKGPLRIADSRRVQLQRLALTDPVAIVDSREIELDNCTFAAPEVGVDARSVGGLRITHGTFAGQATAGVRLEACDAVYLTANIFGSAEAAGVVTDQAEAIRFSDYNAFANPAAAWSVGGTRRAAGDPTWPHDRHPIDATPAFQEDQGVPVVANREAFIGRSMHGTTVGRHVEYVERRIRATPPRLHSLTDTTANIEWRTSIEGAAEVAWGITPDCPNTATTPSGAFATFSLTGLEPGRTYYFAIRSVEARDESEQHLTEALEPEGPPLAFTTLAGPRAPMTWHVSPEGDDRADGRLAATAWRTLSHAASTVLAGDTVIIGAGVYPETVRLRATGDQGRPITFRAAGARVEISGSAGSLAVGIAIVNKSHVHLDGLYYREFLNGGGMIHLRGASHILITRNFMDARGRSTPSQAIGIYDSHHVEVRNSVLASAYRGVYMSGSGEVAFENNVFLRNYMMCVVVRGPTGRIDLNRNIFMEGTADKVTVPMLEISGSGDYHMRDNCYYLRIPDPERKPVWLYGNGHPRTTLAETQAIIDDRGSFAADPQLAVVARTAADKLVDREGQPLTYYGEWIVAQRRLDFPDLLATEPRLVERGIGLDPEALADFGRAASEADGDKQ